MREWYDPDSLISHLRDDELLDEDVDLLRHVLLDDQRPPQGLHQQGFKPICSELGHFFESFGEQRCVDCGIPKRRITA